MIHIVSYLLIAGSLLMVYLLIKLFLESIFHNKWFKNIKPGDEVFVRIYSNFCDCTREAIVIEKIDNNNIKTRMSDKTYKSCIDCANMKAIDEEGCNTCYYFTTEFDKNSVEKK